MTATVGKQPWNWEKILRGLLQCPVCLQAIKHVPVFQCQNGHVICKDCHPRLLACPVCRTEAIWNIRSLISEDIVMRYVLT